MILIVRKVFETRAFALIWVSKTTNAGIYTGIASSDATQHDSECETQLCRQAKRVLDCRSPLCPTHPPTALRRRTHRSRPRDRGTRMRRGSGVEKRTLEGGMRTDARGALRRSLTRQAPRVTARLLSDDLLIPFLSLEPSLSFLVAYSRSRPAGLWVSALSWNHFAKV